MGMDSTYSSQMSLHTMMSTTSEFSWSIIDASGHFQNRTKRLRTSNDWQFLFGSCRIALPRHCDLFISLLLKKFVRKIRNLC
jgi:hypothetical protein